jgi:hypothetical protein
MKPSRHTLEDQPDYVQAIGMVSLETIALEMQLANLLARTISVPLRIGQAIYLSPKSEQSRLDILKNVSRSRLGVSENKIRSELGKQMTKALDDVNKVINRAQALISHRHRIIHDEWNYSDSENKVTRKKVDGKPGNSRAPIERIEIDNLIQKIRSLIDDVHDLADSFKQYPPFMANMRND